jgi:hypothetical protein
MLTNVSNMIAITRSDPEASCIQDALRPSIVKPFVNVLMMSRPRNAPPMPPEPPPKETPPKIAAIIPAKVWALIPVPVADLSRPVTKHPAIELRTALLINSMYDILLGFKPARREASGYFNPRTLCTLQVLHRLMRLCESRREARFRCAIARTERQCIFRDKSPKKRSPENFISGLLFGACLSTRPYRFNDFYIRTVGTLNCT